MVPGQGGALLRPVELHRGGHTVPHGAAGRLVHLRGLGDGLQVPASSLLPGGGARAVGGVLAAVGGAGVAGGRGTGREDGTM